MSSSQSLSGKIALVTGGSRGIGAAIVQQLAAGGAEVFFTYSSSAKAADDVVAKVKAAGGKATAIKADVASKAEIAQLFVTLDKHAPKLDILVNNAGVYLVGPLDTFKDEDYEKSMAINVDGVYYTTRHAVSRLNNFGRIITIGSVLGSSSFGPGHAVYAATKFAVAGLTRGFARDLAPRNITANLVQPGPIDTDMNPDVASNPFADYMKKAVPLGRYGKADEVAAVVRFLASPDAQYISAATINVDGALLA